ncbi:SPOR domain-containing protein [Falsirhodobacter halotolerans]|uniref:SPOR domain-containing protein n=1 Tax=Falsirhodobacter halotolerans TaxID=1146892 RepID=UPI001FD51B9F|nr:SPOR domain-containing protein [Falsirhodobacter halotolerans]MCJ8139751.1 SPOR domain-containing protein [Falsirhodobacter halotolerans]
MADVDFDEFGAVDYAPRRSMQVQRIINIAGAASSVAMIVALAWWGYSTTVRDVRGIPVVQALEGPMRVTPEDPGGSITANQGLSVNEIAASGAAGGVAAELMLAPRTTELDLGDGPGLEGSEPSQEIMEAVAEATGATGAVLMPAGLPAPPPVAPIEAVEQGLASTVDGDPIDEIAIPAPAIDPSLIPDELKTEPVVAPAPPGAVTRSLRPQVRMASAPAAMPVAASPVAAPPSTTAPSGAHLVQLGAFDNEEQVQREWTRLSAKFGSLFSSKSLVMQQAVSGGRTFYRLRASGFEDAADARRFCSALLAENAACIAIVNQ